MIFIFRRAGKARKVFKALNEAVLLEKIFGQVLIVKLNKDGRN